MRALLLFILLISTPLAYGQCWEGDFAYELDFDSGSCLDGLWIDSTNTNNIWQIGAPQKTTFDAAYTAPNVIVTDTLNHYPVNNTSTFYIKHIAGAGFYYLHTAAIGGKYRVQSDSLNDFGSIHFSPDNGNTWLDILNDPTYDNFWEVKPVLTGDSDGWKTFSFNMLDNQNSLGVVHQDTIQFRFTFTSDGTLDSLDGLMYDHINVIDAVSSLDELGLNYVASKAYPNPSSGEITIEFDNSTAETFELKILDASGRVVFMEDEITSNSIHINTTSLDSGLYSYVLKSSAHQSKGKLMIAD